MSPPHEDELERMIERLEQLRERLATRREAFEVIGDVQSVAILSDVIGLIAKAIEPAA